MFRGIDIFGSPFVLNYKGRSSNATIFGSCCSLFLLMITLVLMFSSLRELFSPFYNFKQNI